jgi:antitoxin component YwqK of YwqJK toxin-antitoxin module
MKKLLSILLLSFVLIDCSEERVLMDDLTNKGTVESPIMYFEGALFNGVGFNVYSNGQLKEEGNWKDGELDGLVKTWYENGQRTIN